MDLEWLKPIRRERDITLERWDKIEGIISEICCDLMRRILYLITQDWCYVLALKKDDHLDLKTIEVYISTEMQRASVRRCIEKIMSDRSQLEIAEYF